MTDEERYKANVEFAKTIEPTMTIYMNGNYLAGLRAAGSCVITLEQRRAGSLFQVRMLTSRGTPTFPIGEGTWRSTGTSVVSSSKSAVQFLLALFGISWKEFISEFPFPVNRVPRYISLKDVLEKIKQVA